MSFNIEPLVLHAHAIGPNPIKLAIILEYLSLLYNVKLWAFGNDAEKGLKGATFLRINENGRVPALEDPNTGVVSWESGACVNYLRRQYDKALSGAMTTVTPPGERDAGSMNIMLLPVPVAITASTRSRCCTITWRHSSCLP
jgi:glutathione S-transferase